MCPHFVCADLREVLNTWYTRWGFDVRRRLWHGKHGERGGILMSCMTVIEGGGALGGKVVVALQ